MYYQDQRSIRTKTVNFLADLWPGVYKIINAALSGIIGFIKAIIGGIFFR